MAKFSYQAIDAAGQPVAGELEADNVPQAVAQLESQGLTVQSIGRASSSTRSEGFPATTDRAAKRSQSAGESLEQAVLRSHMATILARGQAITPALRAYAEEMPAGRQRRELLAVCRILEGGDAAEAVTALADLPEYWIPMLSAATSSTDASHVLREFISESRQVDDLRQQWWLTLAYPIVLMGLATMVMLALSIFVIPEFGKMFADFDLELPGLTEFVVGVAAWLSSWAGVSIAVLLVALLVFVFNANRLLPASVFAWFGDRIRLPFGRRAVVARFARFVADLLEAGVGLPDSLRIAGYCVNRLRLRRSAWHLANEIESTDGCSRQVDQRQLSAAVSHVLTADMSTSARVRLLREISECRAERVRLGLSWTTGLVEPLAICVVGFVIGLVVLGLFLPLVKLVDGLSG